MLCYQWQEIRLQVLAVKHDSVDSFLLKQQVYQWTLTTHPWLSVVVFFCWHRGYSRPRQKTWTYCDYWPYCPQRVLLQNLARVQYLQSGAHRYLVFGEEDEQQRKRRGCVAGSLQYPHAGEQKEEGTSERKECADRIKDKLHVPCCSHNLCPGFSFGCEYTVISFYVWFRSSLGSKNGRYWILCVILTHKISELCSYNTSF